MSKHGRIGRVIGYVLGSIIIFMVVHVIAHIVAYVSVNWGHMMLWVIALQFFSIVFCVCLSKYVKTEYFTGVLGGMAWLYIYNHGGTYWVYYFLIWVWFTLGLVLLMARMWRENTQQQP